MVSVFYESYCTECLCLEGGGGGSSGTTTPSGTTISGGYNHFIGNGYCDCINNNLACTYDGGDCCLIVRISLTNEPLDPGYGYLNGDYEISIMPNGQTSWINSNYAIWYTSGHWHIGDLAEIGEQWAYIYATNDFHGLTDNENEWHYWDGSSWISLTDPSDVQITCEN